MLITIGHPMCQTIIIIVWMVMVKILTMLLVRIGTKGFWMVVACTEPVFLLELMLMMLMRIVVRQFINIFW